MKNFRIPDFQEFQNLEWYELRLYFQENPTVEKKEYHKLLDGIMRPFIEENGISCFYYTHYFGGEPYHVKFRFAYTEEQRKSIQQAVKDLKDNLSKLSVPLRSIEEDPYNIRDDIGNRFCKNDQGEIDDTSLYWMAIHWYSGSYYFLSLLRDGNLYEHPDLQGVPHLQHNLQGRCYRVGRWYIDEHNRKRLGPRWNPDMFNLRFVYENNAIVTKPALEKEFKKAFEKAL